MDLEKERALTTVRPSLFGLQFPFFGEDSWWGLDMPSQTGLSVSEDKDCVYVEAQLPGLRPEDIEVTFEHGVLWIRGQRNEKEEDANRKYHFKASSSFSYRCPVPGRINEKKDPEAVYKDGIMRVCFSKLQGSQAKKIPVKIQ